MTRVNLAYVLAALTGSAAVSTGSQGLWPVAWVCLVASLVAGTLFVARTLRAEPEGLSRAGAIAPAVLTAVASLAAWQSRGLPWGAVFILACVPLVAWTLPFMSRVGPRQETNA